MTRYLWVADRKAEGFPTSGACQTAGVSPSGFYDWAARVAAGPTVRDRNEQQLVGRIRAIHGDSGGEYGSIRVCKQLRVEGQRVNRKRVERLMREHAIVGYKAPARPRTTQPADEQCSALADLVRRDFKAGRPNQVYVGDITYIRSGEGFLYLAGVLDLGSRRLCGYSMSDTMKTPLVIDALRMTAALRGKDRLEGVVFHSDRGGQYLSGDYRKVLVEYKIRQSAGRTGSCLDNAVIESFWASLKRAICHHGPFATRAAARRFVFVWINRYNNRRLHSTLDYQTPVAWDTMYDQQPHKAKQAA